MVARARGLTIFCPSQIYRKTSNDENDSYHYYVMRVGSRHFDMNQIDHVTRLAHYRDADFDFVLREDDYGEWSLLPLDDERKKEALKVARRRSVVGVPLFEDLPEPPKSPWGLEPPFDKKAKVRKSSVTFKPGENPFQAALAQGNSDAVK